MGELGRAAPPRRDATPRWDALMRTPMPRRRIGTTRARPARSCTGVLRRAGEDAARLTGTREADILIGGAGDDVLVGHGGDDRLHGGPGEDRAILPGARADYKVTQHGARVILQGPAGRVTLVSVETVEFSGAPGEPLALADLI
ncbi:MAG: hypothetical protein U5L09_09235 [Bacteroidales bacterium]|nr:hypothetical protein [Bacteroidales bacterium]